MGPAKKNKHKLGKAITIPSTSDKAWKHVDPFSGDPEVKLNDFCQKNDLKYTFNNTRKGVRVLFKLLIIGANHACSRSSVIRITQP